MEKYKFYYIDVDFTDNIITEHNYIIDIVGDLDDIDYTYLEPKMHFEITQLHLF